MVTQTVPKYVAIVGINDKLTEQLTAFLRTEEASKAAAAAGISTGTLSTAAIAGKSVIAGVAGAVCTNPIDVIHME